MNIFEKDQDDKYRVMSGMILAIHQRGQLPLLKYDAITVANSISTNVLISRTEYAKLSYPYSTCRKNPDKLLPTDSDFHRKTVSISLYSQRLCCKKLFVIVSLN